MCAQEFFCLVVSTPLKNDGVRQIGSSSQIKGENKTWLKPPTSFCSWLCSCNLCSHAIGLSLKWLEVPFPVDGDIRATPDATCTYMFYLLGLSKAYFISGLCISVYFDFVEVIFETETSGKKTVDAFCIYKFELRKATTGIAWNEKKSLCWPKWSYFHQCKYMQDIWSVAAYLYTSIHYSSLTLAAFEPF
jgi:hypothetical protein